jgi:hypothetical protein
MLVAGDFNSVPGSPAHCLLVNGKIDASMMVGGDMGPGITMWIKAACRRIDYTDEWRHLSCVVGEFGGAGVKSRGGMHLDQARAMRCHVIQGPAIRRA